MNNKVLSELLTTYEKKRLLSSQKCEYAKSKALEIPEYKSLDKQEALITIEIGKQMFLGNKTDALEKQLDFVKSQKAEVLKNHNLDISDFTPKFECNNCKDTGFVDGKMCDCLVQNYFNKLMEISNITFDNIPLISDYSYKCYDDEKTKMASIKKSMITFVDNLKTAQTRNIVFMGNTGVGKTYLAKSIAKTAMSKGNTVIFMTSFNLNNEFLKSHLSNELDKIKLLNNYINCDLLVIDDLGSEPKLKNVTSEYLLILINERIARKKATIITTNLEPDNIMSIYGQRFASRIFNKQDSTLIKITGKDLRTSK